MDTTTATVVAVCGQMSGTTLTVVKTVCTGLGAMQWEVVGEAWECG